MEHRHRQSAALILTILPVSAKIITGPLARSDTKYVFAIWACALEVYTVRGSKSWQSAYYCESCHEHR